MDQQTTTAGFVPNWSPIPYELRIGVTGHRHLDDPVEVSAKVREVLKTLLSVLEGASAEPLGKHGSPQSVASRLDRRLAEAFAAGTSVIGAVEAWAETLGSSPSRSRRIVRALIWPAVTVSPRDPSQHQQTPVKLTAISALASGADQIVTRAICDLVREQSIERNRYVEAVLPIPQSIYEQDFASPADRAEFRALLALDCGAANTHPEPTVCFPHFPNTSDPAYPTGQAAREDAYAAASRHVVDTSEIVIAIWNPARDGGSGGTEGAIREALESGRLVLWLNPDQLNDGAWALRPKESARYSSTAKHEPGPEESGPVPPMAPHFCTVAPIPTRAKDLSPNFHRLAAYNRDTAVSDAALERSWQREQSALAAHASRWALPRPVTQVFIEHLLPRFVRAELLSQRYQRLRNAATRVWPLSAALVVTLMAFQVVFLPSQYWLAWVELAVLLVGYASNRVSVYEGWHEKWLNDRRLAEGLRSASYAVMALDDSGGTRTRPSHAQDPLPFYNPANTWYVASMKREVAKSRRLFSDALSLHNLEHRGTVRGVLLDAWIRPRAVHHRDNAKKHRRLAGRARWLRLALLVLIVAVATGHALGIGHHEGETTSGLRRVDLWLGLLTVALPAWAAAFHVMLSLDDHDRLAERSDRMATLLDGLVERLATAQTVHDVRDRVAEAERIMDLETAEWAESLVDRRPEFTG
jgi:hypothetical protein